MPAQTGEKSIGLASGLDSIRFATILFADIVGSTQLLRTLDPEDASDLIDTSLALVQRAIHAFDGLVVRVQGDGVMAVFGIHPKAQDHALRAALAARRIIDELEQAAARPTPAPQVRIGIHAGPILLRRQDHDFGTLIDVVGHAAHVAGQIEQLASPGCIGISASTVSLISENCDLRMIGRIAVDGQDARSEDHGEAVFALKAINFAGSDRVPVKGNASFPLFGRDHDLEQVRAMIAGLPAGHCAALGFIGDPGMGKSRLLLEASRIAAGFGVTFAVIRGNGLTAAVPFGCLMPAVRHVVEMLRPFSPDPAKAAGLSADQIECLKGFMEGNVAWLPGLTPGDRIHIATQTLVRLVRQTIKYLPLLVLIDDMQYVDTATRSVLVGIRQGTRLGIIATGRPEATLRITTLCGTPSRLNALSPAASRDLVTHISRSVPLEDTTVAKILARADGLPLALQEFALTAQISGSAVALPARLENLLAERLAELDNDAARLCQFCATLGPSFPASHLAKAAVLVCQSPALATAHLIESRVIEAAQADVVRFTHQLVQEVAYATMTRGRRTAMHKQALELLEIEAASHAERATHAEKAGLLERALDHLWNACEDARSLAANSSVLALYRRARGVAARLDPVSARVQQARFSLLALDTLQQSGHQEEARPDIHAVASGQINLGAGMQTLARINMALLERNAGAPESGAAWLAQAEADLDRHESLPLRTFADAVGAYIANARAKPDEAIARIRRLGQRLDTDKQARSHDAVVMIPYIMSRAFGAWYSVDLGEVAQACSWLAEAFGLSRRYRHNYSRLLANLTHGYLHYRTGNVNKAVACLRRSYIECLQHRLHTCEPLSAGWLALCLIQQGHLEEAADLLRAVEERGYHKHGRTAAMAFYFHEARARLAIAQGDALRAASISAEALEHCRNCGEAMHELHALVLQAEVRAAFAQAPEPLDELRQKITALRLVPLIARLDGLAQQSGDH